MTTTRRQFFKMAAAGGAGLASIMRGPLVRTARASDQYSSVVLAKGRSVIGARGKPPGRPLSTRRATAMTELTSAIRRSHSRVRSRTIQTRRSGLTDSIREISSKSWIPIVPYSVSRRAGWD